MFDFVGSRPTLSDQLGVIRYEAAQLERHTAFSRRIDLRGAGEDSFIMVLRHDALPFRLRYGRPEPDELRIYDVSTRGELELRFRFRPAARPGEAFTFRIERIGDVDGNGRPEIIGAWELFAMQPVLPRPVVIAWDDGDQAYEMNPILARERSEQQFSRPPLVRPRGGYAIASRQTYLESAPIRNAVGSGAVASYVVEDFFIDKRAASTALVAGFVVRARRHADAPGIQMVWTVDLQLPKPEVFVCYDGSRTTSIGGEARVFVAKLYPLALALRQQWRSTRSFC